MAKKRVSKAVMDELDASESGTVVEDSFLINHPDRTPSVSYIPGDGSERSSSDVPLEDTSGSHVSCELIDSEQRSEMSQEPDHDAMLTDYSATSNTVDATEGNMSEQGALADGHNEDVGEELTTVSAQEAEMTELDEEAATVVAAVRQHPDNKLFDYQQETDECSRQILENLSRLSKVQLTDYLHGHIKYMKWRMQAYDGVTTFRIDLQHQQDIFSGALTLSNVQLYLTSNYEWKCEAMVTRLKPKLIRLTPNEGGADPVKLSYAGYSELLVSVVGATFSTADLLVDLHTTFPGINLLVAEIPLSLSFVALCGTDIESPVYDCYTVMEISTMFTRMVRFPVRLVLPRHGNHEQLRVFLADVMSNNIIALSPVSRLVQLSSDKKLNAALIDIAANGHVLLPNGVLADSHVWSLADYSRLYRVNIIPLLTCKPSMKYELVEAMLKLWPGIIRPHHTTPNFDGYNVSMSTNQSKVARYLAECVSTQHFEVLFGVLTSTRPEILLVQYCYTEQITILDILLQGIYGGEHLTLPVQKEQNEAYAYYTCVSGIADSILTKLTNHPLIKGGVYSYQGQWLGLPHTSSTFGGKIILYVHATNLEIVKVRIKHHNRQWIRMNACDDPPSIDFLHAQTKTSHIDAANTLAHAQMSSNAEATETE